MISISLLFFFYKKAEEEGIQFKHTPVCIEMLKHIINYINRNMSEEVNVDTHKSLLVDNRFFEMVYTHALLENI